MDGQLATFNIEWTSPEMGEYVILAVA